MNASVPLSELEQRAMHAALAEAHTAAVADEVPVGAVIMHSRTGEIVARAHNRMRRDHDATSHAELLAVRAAAATLGDRGLQDYTLAVTLEPCAMCAGAIVLARVGTLLFGAWDDKAGMCGSVGDVVRHGKLNHRPAVRGGVLEHECSAILKAFFAQRR
ncbi:nucleoside deaminase [Gemmatimonas sp.]|jgi:tRNA(adenine34) deaminase|uniref:nucleoside deaminase n=1 Tax=Gemmatimonas sp. TaxID=1962908 RepID=UPI0037C0C5FE